MWSWWYFFNYKTCFVHISYMDVICKIEDEETSPLLNAVTSIWLFFEYITSTFNIPLFFFVVMCVWCMMHMMNFCILTCKTTRFHYLPSNHYYTFEQYIFRTQCPQGKSCARSTKLWNSTGHVAFTHGYSVLPFGTLEPVWLYYFFICHKINVKRRTTFLFRCIREHATGKGPIDFRPLFHYRSPRFTLTGIYCAKECHIPLRLRRSHPP